MPVRANRALRTSRNMARDGLRMAFPTILASIPASNSFMWPLSLRMSLLLSARQRTRARSPLGGVEAPRRDKVTLVVTIRPQIGRRPTSGDRSSPTEATHEHRVAELG